MSPFPIAQDRLVRKEVALGVIREIVPPTNHIGLTLVAPFLEVQSDDVIFDYAKGLTDGLAPARADDAESELAQKDDTFVGQGRAAVIDWAHKDSYTASDVERYREALLIAERTRDSLNLPLTITSMTEGFQQKMARDQSIRRRKLDNRLEWLIMGGLDLGNRSYNDGKIKWTVDWGRPAEQTDQDPANGYWSETDSDPIDDITQMQEYMYDTYGVRMTKAIGSTKALNNLSNSSKFIARTGLISGTGTDPVDPRYLLDGWGPLAARQVVERATGVQFLPYDSVYRTRPIGSNTVTSNRYTRQNYVIFLPEDADVSEIDDTEIGFAKTLTSPHPAGNWTPGYYEWEKDHGVDPWRHDMGTGIKAFPVFPHMDLTYTMKVLDD